MHTSIPIQNQATGEITATQVQHGMTLRDYFAAKALNGLLAGRILTRQDFEQNARAAYLLADAMLKERGAA